MLDLIALRIEPGAAGRVNAALVTVWPAIGEALEATTDEAGIAVISGIEAGGHQVVVRHPDFRLPPVVPARLVDGRTLAIDVAVDRGVSASGVVQSHK